MQRSRPRRCRFNYIPGVPLIACASEGQDVLLRHLLRQPGVDGGIRDFNGNTALRLARKNGRTGAAAVLEGAAARGDPGAGAPVAQKENLSAAPDS